MGLLKRCPSCRESCDAEKGSCFACGADLAEARPATGSGNPSTVIQEGKRDRNRTSAILLVLGILGLAGAFQNGSGELLVLSLSAALVGTCTLLARILLTEAAYAASLRFQAAAASVLCFAALLGGLVALVKFACTRIAIE